MRKWLRYADLKARGTVKSWAQLKNLQTKCGFPQGRLLSPNTRAWDEETEIIPWEDSRPTETKPTPKGDWKRGRKSKAAVESTNVEA
jgi:hypothetical protein